jgi:membrane protein DedA with SNARE-associated domain
VDIAQITQTLRDDAVTVVFLNVLLQQIGLPVPAVPTLLLAGSLATTSGSLGKVLAAAIIASVIADWIWYLSGKSVWLPSAGWPLQALDQSIVVCQSN